MRKAILLIIVVFLFVSPVSAMEITPPEVPEEAREYMPYETESFGEGLWYIVKKGIEQLHPALAESAGVCLSIIAVVLLTSLLHSFEGYSKTIVTLVSTVVISLLLLKPANVLIGLGIDTVEELSEYGKLLLPTMATALAAQGAAASSASLYMGTTLFNTILTTLIANIVVPALYIYIAVFVANNAVSDDLLTNICKLIKWLITWALKIVLYVFSAYITITGVVSGSADASAVKAAKIAISGAVPVVGNILSDASETILVSAGIMKSAAGVTGVLALLAVWISPFVKIGAQYILLKLTAAICGLYGNKQSIGLIKDFSSVMGFLLAMIGTICLLHLISTVCFIKGAG